MIDRQRQQPPGDEPFPFESRLGAGFDFRPERRYEHAETAEIGSIDVRFGQKRITHRTGSRDGVERQADPVPPPELSVQRVEVRLTTTPRSSHVDAAEQS